MGRKGLREGFSKATAPPNEVSRSLGHTHVDPLGHDNDRMRRPSEMDERNWKKKNHRSNFCSDQITFQILLVLLNLLMMIFQSLLVLSSSYHTSQFRKAIQLINLFHRRPSSLCWIIPCGIITYSLALLFLFLLLMLDLTLPWRPDFVPPRFYHDGPISFLIFLQL
jgi:hypothetical protein